MDHINDIDENLEFTADVLSGHYWLKHNTVDQSMYTAYAILCDASGQEDLVKSSYTCRWCKHFGTWGPQNAQDFFYHTFLCTHRQFTCVDTSLTTNTGPRCTGFSWHDSSTEKKSDPPRNILNLAPTPSRGITSDDERLLLLDAYSRALVFTVHAAACQVKTHCKDCQMDLPFCQVIGHIQEQQKKLGFQMDFQQVLRKLKTHVDTLSVQHSTQASNELLSWLVSAELTASEMVRTIRTIRPP